MMMKRVCLPLLALLAGCAQPSGPDRFNVYEAPSLPPVAVPQVKTEPSAPVCPPKAIAQAEWLGKNMANLRLGTTPRQVEQVVGPAAYVRSLALKDGTEREVLFYHTPQTICRVPANDLRLLPMVFQDNRLVGYGAPYYARFVAPQVK